MQRLVLAALFVVAVLAIGAFLARSAAAFFAASDERSARQTGSGMQRIAFFLLLAVMAYAIMSGGA